MARAARPSTNSDRRQPVRRRQRTGASSESQSGVHRECDGVRRRPAYRPLETDWQVRLKEVTSEEAVFTLEGEALVHQRRKSPRRGVYIVRRS